MTGFKDQVDGTSWLVTEVQHQISSSGFTSRIEVEGAGLERSGGGAVFVGNLML